MNNWKNNFILPYMGGKFENLQFASIDEINRIQTDRFFAHLNYAAEKSPFYKNWFRKNSIDTSSIRVIADVEKLPFTTKFDLNNSNNEFLAVPENEIVDVCLTSASTGSHPASLFQTASDLSRLAYNEKIALGMTGILPDDVLLECAALDRCFMAGLAYFMGGVAAGARMVRAGSGSAAQHWALIKLTGVTAIVGVPSLIRKIGEYALDNGENPAEAGIKKIIAIGETVRDGNFELLPSSGLLEKMWNARIYSTYASTELATTYCECESGNGGHLRPELILTEIIGETGRAVSRGETGEVVVTPLGVRGMPLVRFKTGDISFIAKGKCSCGRNTERLGPVLGRKNQMLKYKGTTVFPNSILSVLEGIKGFLGGYIEVDSFGDGTDRIKIFAAVKALSKECLVEELRASVRVVPEIEIITEKQMMDRVYPAEKRKRVTFFDKRRSGG